MKPKPYIALNCEVDTAGTGKIRVNRSYVEAVRLAGGIPLPLAPMPSRDLRQVLDIVSGFIFIGGNDYSPSNYGEEPHPSVQLLHPVREEFDLRLMGLALRAKDSEGQAKPILGICGGCQLLNIRLGGSLTQDIESVMPGRGVLHRNREDAARHDIKLVPGTELAQVFAGKGRVKRPISSHHQCVKRLGKGLVVSGLSEDGIVEAIEYPKRPFTIGVQWHPEADYRGSAALFESLIFRARQMIL